MPTRAPAAPEDIVAESNDYNEGAELAPLFEGEAVSDAELRGETTEEEPAISEPTGETRSDEKDTGDEETGKEEEAPAKDEEKEGDAAAKEEEEKPAAEDDTDKGKDDAPKAPPEGYVPVAAVQYERQKRHTAQAEADALRAELEGLRAKASADEEGLADFKVLTTKEFDNLLEEDPDAAAKYQYRYQRYREHQDNVVKEQAASTRAKEQSNTMVREGTAAIKALLPGFGTAGDKEVSALVEYAEKHGFDPDVLDDVTNPATKIVTAKGDQYILGAGAASIVKMIKNAHAVPSAENLRKEIEAELRPKIEAEVQKTLVEKVTSGNDFKSLDTVTTTSDKDVRKPSRILSEAELAKLSPDEQERYLGAAA